MDLAPKKKILLNANFITPLNGFPIRIYKYIYYVRYTMLRNPISTYPGMYYVRASVLCCREKYYPDVFRITKCYRYCLFERVKLF